MSSNRAIVVRVPCRRMKSHERAARCLFACRRAAFKEASRAAGPTAISLSPTILPARFIRRFGTVKLTRSQLMETVPADGAGAASSRNVRTLFGHFSSH